MGETSAIEWTDATWNPTTGCTKVSRGCDHCYAEGIFNRFNGPGAFDTVKHHSERLHLPYRWRKPRRVFVNSMSDLFHDAIDEQFIAQVFAVMAANERHTFQVLTKRHARMRSLLTSARWSELLVQTGRWPSDLDPERPAENVWLGVSVEDQQWADIRVAALVDTPAAVRFLSCEPLLGPVDLSAWMPSGFARWRCSGCHRFYSGVARDICRDCGRFGYWSGSHTGNGRPNGQPLGWVIVGGESGTSARPMERGWAYALRDQCVAAGVPFFFKQWGTYDAAGHRAGKKAAGRILDGRTWDEYPAMAVAS